MADPDYYWAEDSSGPRADHVFTTIVTLVSSLFIVLAGFNILSGHYLTAFGNLGLGAAWAVFLPLRRVWFRIGYRDGARMTLDAARLARMADRDLDAFITSETIMQSLRAATELRRRPK